MLNSEEFYEAIPESGFQSIEDLPDSFTLYDDDRIKVCWAPFDGIQPDSKIVIVGITPGWQQAEIAYAHAATCRLAGKSYPEAAAEIKMKASFAGSMRKNLISMLDEITLNSALNLPSTSFLFEDSHKELVHTTSALRYPVFKEGENYAGHSPSPDRHPFLKQMIMDILIPELSNLSPALIIPLGKSAQACIELARTEGHLNLAVLEHFPHPSGANGHRLSQFNKERENLSRTVKQWAGMP